MGIAYVFLELANDLEAEPVEIAIVLELGYDVVFANTVVVSAFHDSAHCTGFLKPKGRIVPVWRQLPSEIYKF